MDVDVAMRAIMQEPEPEPFTMTEAEYRVALLEHWKERVAGGSEGLPEHDVGLSAKGRAAGGVAALRREPEAVKRERHAMLGDRARLDAAILQIRRLNKAMRAKDEAIRQREAAISARDEVIRGKDAEIARLRALAKGVEVMLAAIEEEMANRDKDQALRLTRADAEIREKSEAIRGRDEEIARLRAEAYGVEVTDVETGVTRIVEEAGAAPPRKRMRLEQKANARTIAAAQERLVEVKREHAEERAAGAAVHSELRASVDDKVQAAVTEALAQVADALECACCLERLAPGAAVALECGHTYCNRDTCASSSVKECPECRRPIGARVPLFGALANVCELLSCES